MRSLSGDLSDDALNMKHEKWFSTLCLLTIIAGAIMKILHLPYGKELLNFGVAGMAILQWFLVIFLKKRIKELESKVKI